MKKNQWYVLTIILACLTFGANAQTSLHLKDLKMVGKVDERFQSYNVEMCEVIGGDFWIPYNLIDSVRKTTNKKGIDALKWKIEPINLYESKLINLAKALGPVSYTHLDVYKRQPLGLYPATARAG